MKENFNTILLRNLIPDNYLCEVCLFRNEEDEYDISVEYKTNENVSEVNKLMFSILANRSNWSHSIGWRNIFGLNIDWLGNSYYLVGIETVEPHATRTSYLKATIYIYKKSTFPISGLSKLRETLFNSFGDRWKSKISKSKKKYYTIPIFDISGAKEFIIAEFYIIDLAIRQSNKSGRNINFQTLCMFEERMFDDKKKNSIICDYGDSITGYNRLQTEYFSKEALKWVYSFGEPISPYGYGFLFNRK